MVGNANPIAKAFAAVGGVTVIFVSEIDGFVEVVLEESTDVGNLPGGSFMRGAAVEGRARKVIEEFAYIHEAKEP